ncbi:MAG: DUF4013 domain-containing protein [Halobacteriales archaeon]
MPPAILPALSYPVAGTRRERPLVGLWILLGVAFVVPLLPVVPAVGYLIRVLVASDRGESAPALLADVRTLLEQGIVGAVLVATFLAGPIAVLAITFYGALFGGGGLDPGGLSTPAFYAASTAMVISALLGAYLLPIALFRYGRAGAPGAAFEFRWLRGAGTHGAYFAGWTLGATIGTLGIGLARVLADATRIGPVLAALVIAYAAVVTCHVWGRTLARVH